MCLNMSFIKNARRVMRAAKKPARTELWMTIKLIAVGLVLAPDPAISDDTQRPRTPVPEFGGPSSVGAELNEGDGLTDPVYRFDFLQRALSPWFDFKKELKEDHGLSLGLDYQTLLQRVTDSPGEGGATGAVFRGYGSWTMLGRNSNYSGSLVFKVEHRQRLGTDLAPQDLGFDAGALAIRGLASPMSALGHKQTFSDTLSNVCLRGNSGHWMSAFTMENYFR